MVAPSGRYGFAIVMSYIEKIKAVSQWLLISNLRIFATCAFHIYFMHTTEIIDMVNIYSDL